MDTLKAKPYEHLQRILKRLTDKHHEWCTTLREFNVIWRDQIEKNYLRSLDHQAHPFKNNDSKLLRGKSIIQQLEDLYDEVCIFSG